MPVVTALADHRPSLGHSLGIQDAGDLGILCRIGGGIGVRNGRGAEQRKHDRNCEAPHGIYVQHGSITASSQTPNLPSRELDRRTTATFGDA